MKKTAVVLPVLAGAMMLVLAGCNTEREKGSNRAYLKHGQQVSGDMVGWVAIPNTSPASKEATVTIKGQAEKFNYAVLATHNLVPFSMQDWVAISPSLFAKMTQIKVEAPTGTSDERWVLKPEGKRVPEYAEGWVAVPYSEPEIGSSEHLKAARLSTDNVIPKEMNGYVALDRFDLAKLVEQYMMTGKGSETGKVSKAEN